MVNRLRTAGRQPEDRRLSGTQSDVVPVGPAGNHDRERRRSVRSGVIIGDPRSQCQRSHSRRTAGRRLPDSSVRSCGQLDDRDVAIGVRSARNRDGRTDRVRGIVHRRTRAAAPTAVDLIECVTALPALAATASGARAAAQEMHLRRTVAVVDGLTVCRVRTPGAAGGRVAALPRRTPARTRRPPSEPGVAPDSTVLIVNPRRPACTAPTTRHQPHAVGARVDDRRTSATVAAVRPGSMAGITPVATLTEANAGPTTRRDRDRLLAVQVDPGCDDRTLSRHALPVAAVRAGCAGQHGKDRAGRRRECDSGVGQLIARVDTDLAAWAQRDRAAIRGHRTGVDRVAGARQRCCSLSTPNCR